MRVRDIAVDIVDVQRRIGEPGRPHLWDTEVMYYLLRVLHVMATSMERVADAYCARHPNVPRFPEGT